MYAYVSSSQEDTTSLLDFQADCQPPAAFLVELPVAATIINRIDGDLDRCLQVAFMLDTLDTSEE